KTIGQLDVRREPRPAVAGTGSNGEGVGPTQVRVGIFTLAETNAARERSGIVEDPVVGDLQVMPPPVHEDATAPLGAVGDAHGIDARRVALEVARVRIGNVALAARRPSPAVEG